MRFNIFQTYNEIYLIVPWEDINPIGTTLYEMIGRSTNRSISVMHFQRENYQSLFFEISTGGYNVLWDSFDKNTIHEIQNFLMSNSIKIDINVLQYFFKILNLPY
jgi:hypothetical protein